MNPGQPGPQVATGLSQQPAFVGTLGLATSRRSGRGPLLLMGLYRGEGDVGRPGLREQAKPRRLFTPTGGVWVFLSSACSRQYS
jgi:hypothetical protein